MTTDATSFDVGSSGVQIGNSGSVRSIADGNPLLLQGSKSSNAGYSVQMDNYTSYGNTFGTDGVVQIGGFNFTPFSGNASYYALDIIQTFNQTGSANGITRSEYLNLCLLPPTITATWKLPL